MPPAVPDDQSALTDDPLALAAEMRRALSGRRLGPIHAVDAGPASGQIPPGGIPRLTVVLEGLRRIRCPGPAGAVCREVAAGGGIVVTPQGWSQPQPSPPHRYLSINCYPDFTRFRISRLPRDLAGDGAYHSGGPPAAPARALLGALVALAEERAEERLAALLPVFLDEILRECRPWEGSAAGRADWQRACVWIHDHIGPGLGREAVAAAAGVHPNHLSRLCRRFAGCTLAGYLGEVRMRRARELLRTGDLPVARIARLVGFGDESHFRKRFKHLCGETPGSCRRQGGRCGR